MDNTNFETSEETPFFDSFPFILPQAPPPPPPPPARRWPFPPNRSTDTAAAAQLKAAKPKPEQPFVDPARKLFYTRRAIILHQCYQCWLENDRDPHKITYEGTKTCIRIKLCENCRAANISMCNQYYAAGFTQSTKPPTNQ